MENLYGKTFSQNELDRINSISQRCGILMDTARILYCRNIDTPEKAKRFLNPSSANFNDPFLLKGVKEAVERLKTAKQNGQTVLVFGDYDADGICATTVLSNCLLEYGINTITAIPEREEGYGLNKAKISQINAQTPVDLIVTVDCGISDFEVISILKDEGVDVIVTDHHEPPELLPPCITINPKIKGQDYPFDALCGAGVAYKLGYALIGDKANEYLDFVALATVADSMELIDENRDLVVEGLKLFSENKIRSAFKHLMGDGDKKITSSTLAYTVAPRVNAGGRMGDANSALRLFTSTSQSEIFELSVRLNSYNMFRQAECDRVYSLAKDIINNQKLYNNSVIMVCGDDWNAGVIGIVSSRLVEDYHRPVITFALCDDYYKGSARSVEGINIYEIISASKDVLKTFGGHSQAAGVSVDKDKFTEFCNQTLASYGRLYKDFVYTRKSEVEWEISTPVSIRFAKELSLLEPYGLGNKKPLFSTTVESVVAKPLKVGSPHYSFDTPAVQMLDFNGEADIEPLYYPIKKRITFEINYSVFRSVQSVKGFVKSVQPDYTDLTQLKPYVLRRQLVNLLCAEQLDVEQISSQSLPLDQKYGVLYVVNDYENLNLYPQLKTLPVDLFEVEDKGCLSRIVICPKCISTDYQTVIYLDKPIGYVKTQAQVKLVNGAVGYNALKSLKTDRESFAKMYGFLASLNGMPFVDSIRTYNEHTPKEFDLDSFVFATEVFMELNFFRVQQDVIYTNYNVKSSLTNSVIYSTICSIKDNL